jgi:hypothetical protein
MIVKKAEESENNIQSKAEIIEESMSVEGTIVNYVECENEDLIVIGTQEAELVLKRCCLEALPLK